MGKKSVYVRVDWREERSPYVIQEVQEHPEVEDYKVTELEEGDIEITESWEDDSDVILFERKDVSDFANSMLDEDDHMRDQVERLNEATNDSPRVLIEGNMEDFRSLKHTKVKVASLRGFVASLEERHWAKIKFCSDIKGLVDYAIRASRKNFEDESSSLRVRSAVKKSEPFTMRFFGLVKGVGPETAKSLYNHFPTVESAVQASKEDFLEVDGIGPKTASKLYESFRQ